MKSEQLKEPTVEEALAQLERIFGDANNLITQNDTNAFANPALNHWVIIYRYEQFKQHQIGSAATLSEAMRQVRAWHKAQELNTVLPQEREP